MKIAFLLAALCGMLLATTAMTFDDDEMDQLEDPMSMGKCRGCMLRNDLEEPLTADEIEDMLHMMDPQGIRRGGRGERGGRGDRGRGDRGRGDRGRGYGDGRGGYNEDIFQSPATTAGDEMMQDPIIGLGWGWGRPWGGWGGWGRGWGGWGRGWGWGGRGWGRWGRGWGRRYFDSDDSSNQEMQGEEPETISADDLEDMMTLDPQGGRGGGYRGDRDRYRGDRDRYRGDRDRYGGDRDRYRGDRDRYRGDRDRYRGRRNDMEL